MEQKAQAFIKSIYLGDTMFQTVAEKHDNTYSFSLYCQTAKDTICLANINDLSQYDAIQCTFEFHIALSNINDIIKQRNSESDGTRHSISLANSIIKSDF